MKQKVRVRFAKLPELAFLSHHDLMRTFHRALRRAGLPVCTTRGYNPRPRVVFLHALEVGIPSLEEAVEIELEDWLPLREIERRLKEALPPGQEVGAAELIPPRRRGAAAVEAVYEAELDGRDIELARKGIESFLARESVEVERRKPDAPVRTVDIRPNVAALELDGRILKMRLRLGITSFASAHHKGSPRPREVLAAVLSRPAEEMLDVPVRKVRTVLAGRG